VILKKEWSFAEVIPLSRKPQKLPVVLSPEEVLHFLDCVERGKHRVILTTCYAAGLRVSEAVQPRPNATDSRRMVIRVELSKSGKDRYVMLSAKLLDILRSYWRATRPKEWLATDDRSAVEDGSQKAHHLSALSKPVTLHSLRHAHHFQQKNRRELAC
jgi:integrase/recombinase XerD